MSIPYNGGTPINSKTITAATTLTNRDSGKQILVDYSANAAISVALPAVKKGLILELTWITQMTASSCQINFRSPSGAATLKGGVLSVEDDGTDGGFTAAGSVNELQITDDTNVGSTLKFVSDGTYWYVSGRIMTNSGSKADFTST